LNRHFCGLLWSPRRRRSQAFSGLRMQYFGVCCCSWKSLSSTPVSVPSTPHPNSLVPDVVHTYPGQCPPPFLSFPAYTHLRHSCLPFAGHIRARRSSYEGSNRSTPAHQPPLQSSSRVPGLSRSARCTGRVGRCSPRTHPCMSLPNARSLAACLAVQWMPVPLPLRPRLPWLQMRPPSPSQELLALGRARPCDRDRPARCPGWAHGRVGFTRAPGAVYARAETARVAGR
jgi:hypothetical protein